MSDDRIKLGVLWKNVSRNGNKPYLSGRVQQEGIAAAFDLLRAGGRFLVLGNNKRPDKQDPDCVLWVVPEQERNQHGAGDARSAPAPAAAPTNNYRNRTPRPGSR